MRNLEELIPPTGSWNADSYFFGTVDSVNGTFTLHRNGLPKFRILAPVVRGRVKPGKPGSILEVSIVPGLGFWLFLVGPFVVALPALITLFAHRPDPVFWLLSGFIGLTFTVCFTGTALLVYALNLRHCRAELMRLVSTDGQSSGA